MRGIEALEYFLESWQAKLREFDEYDEFDAMIEYVFGNERKFFDSKVFIDRFFDRKIHFDLEEEINEFLPEEIEFDPFSGNLYIKRNLFEIKIAPKIY
ncbi:conserved hypothetical protein [Lebetimonas natsushimae]|uniref:Uncharacterized protein n=1 Tax=Lebetimonas natsushimae TaxID=1936991 RepID=A0A292YFS0_9BACT|nr:hypothetical protein [Lebetimonas natsushimae]GAX87933.1 conserved hypothetical protein [Lebetimonas natsushimae]